MSGLCQNCLCVVNKFNKFVFSFLFGCLDSSVGSPIVSRLSARVQVPIGSVLEIILSLEKLVKNVARQVKLCLQAFRHDKF